MTKSFVTAIALLLLSSCAPAFAKEITSGGGGVGGTTTCNPVSSLTAKGDPRVGETGLSSIDVSYSVKPCINGQMVRVQTDVYESLTGASAYLNTDSPLNGKFTVFGIKVRTSYTVRVTVTDTATNAVVGTQTIFAAAIPKGV